MFFTTVPAVDNFSRQCLAIHVGQSLKGEDVVAVMNQLKIVNLAVPNRIQVDNGAERSAAQRFISKALDKWCYDNSVRSTFQDLGNQRITLLLSPLTVALEMSA